MTATAIEIYRAIDRAKREILADIASGRVPATVADFSTLHDYVDANEYGGLCEAGGPFDLGLDAEVSIDSEGAAKVQDAVHSWLVSGRPATIGRCGRADSHGAHTFRVADLARPHGRSTWCGGTEFIVTARV